MLHNIYPAGQGEKPSSYLKGKKGGKLNFTGLKDVIRLHRSLTISEVVYHYE